MVRSKRIALVLALIGTGAGTAAAQDGPQAASGGSESPPPAAEPTEKGAQGVDAGEGEPEPGVQRLGDAQAVAEEQMETQETRSATDPYEDPEEAYMFIGAFYRHTWTPEFMMNLFLDESTAANNPGVGIEFTYRRAGFDLIANVYWQRFAVEGPFRGSGDPDVETEIVDSSLSTAMVGISALWSTEFNDIVALEYGLDFAIGGVIGDLHRNEAYPSDGGYEACDGPKDPNDTGGYCDEPPDGHYGNEPRWTGGGDVPVVWFRVGAPHLALRIKPIRQLMTRIDFGFDVFSGFFVGAAAAYGI